MSRADSGNPEQQGQQGGAQQLKDTASQLASQARDMGTQARDAASQQINQLREQATEQYDHLREQATEYYQAGRERAAEWQGQVEEYVRAQPVKAVLMAAGVGVLLGIIWKRS